MATKFITKNGKKIPIGNKKQPSKEFYEIGVFKKDGSQFSASYAYTKAKAEKKKIEEESYLDRKQHADGWKVKIINKSKNKKTLPISKKNKYGFVPEHTPSSFQFQSTTARLQGNKQPVGDKLGGATGRRSNDPLHPKGDWRIKGGK